VKVRHVRQQKDRKDNRADDENAALVGRLFGFHQLVELHLIERSRIANLAIAQPANHRRPHHNTEQEAEHHRHHLAKRILLAREDAEEAR